MLEPVPAEATPPAERDDDTMTTAIRQRMRNQRSVGLQKLKARCHNIAYGYYIPAFDIPSFFGQLSLHAEVMPPLGYYIVKTDRSGEEEVPKLWKKKGWNVKDGPPRERPPRPEDDLVVDLEHTCNSLLSISTILLLPAPDACWCCCLLPLRTFLNALNWLWCVR